jgi:ribosomal protein S18 acetylase RimI-like enzyme
VIGFIAGALDTGEFYRRFLRRHWVKATWAMLPRVVRPSVIRQVVEVLRHGATESRARSELLSMAVAPTARRRGVGRRLVEELVSWARQKGVDRMKVVVAVGNEPAVALYRSNGFVDGGQIKVHGDAPSWELVWSG